MRFLLIAALLLAGTGMAQAHAIIMESTPAKNATITQPSFTIKLRFNSRIDVKRSVIKLIGPDKQIQMLKISDQSADDTLIADTDGGIAPGAWKIRWQVLSVDGHITRGDIPFVETAQ